MHLASYAQTYRKNAVGTASRGELVLMLFDGTLRFLSAAVRGFEEGNIGRRNEQIHNNLIKAQNILRELQVSLDLQAGGDFARRMFALYDFMLHQLQGANFKKERAPIHDVERLLGELREAWGKMLLQSSGVEAAVAA
jgi:flagellar secretion chaperone FliS